MRRDLTVSQSIDINTDPSQVWHALTTPDIIKEYLFGTETVTNWKVGDEIIFQGKYKGHMYRDKGVILENRPNQLLRYTYWSGFSGLEDKPENYSTVTYTLTKRDATHTTFTWTQEGYATEEAYTHSKSGMEAFLQQVKEIIER